MIPIFIVMIMIGFGNPALALSLSSALQATAVAIPGGEKGVRLDDLNFSQSLHKVLIPAGQTGKLYLIDPDTLVMTPIGGFSSSTEDKKGHHAGTSSADGGDGFIFTVDHGAHQLDAVDTKTGKIMAQAALTTDPDIIRYVQMNHEVWATEPDEKDVKQIEVFSFTPGEKPVLAHTMFISVPDGPESLTIDGVHQRAYTNLGDQVAAIDLRSHSVVAQWPNSCAKPRGTAIVEDKNYLLVACGEGKAVVFDLNQGGKQVSSLSTGPGADLIFYNPGLSHLYITGSKNATLSVLGVSSKGELSLLGVGQAAERAHCVTGDDRNNIWVCDPHHGQLLRYKDNYPLVK